MRSDLFFFPTLLWKCYSQRLPIPILGDYSVLIFASFIDPLLKVLSFGFCDSTSPILFSSSLEVAQTVKHLPAVRETRVPAVGWEDPLEKEMATHSSALAWKIPWTEEPGRLQSMGVTKSWTRLSHFTSLHRVPFSSSLLGGIFGRKSYRRVSRKPFD